LDATISAESQESAASSPPGLKLACIALNQEQKGTCSGGINIFRGRQQQGRAFFPQIFLKGADSVSLQ
jgi:hypothetical protein